MPDFLLLVRRVVHALVVQVLARAVRRLLRVVVVDRAAAMVLVLVLVLVVAVLPLGRVDGRVAVVREPARRVRREACRAG